MSPYRTAPPRPLVRPQHVPWWRAIQRIHAAGYRSEQRWIVNLTVPFCGVVVVAVAMAVGAVAGATAGVIAGLLSPYATVPLYYLAHGLLLLRSARRAMRAHASLRPYTIELHGGGTRTHFPALRAARDAARRAGA